MRSLVAMIGLIIGLGCASDLFNLWIWFEAMAIASYLLVAFYRQQSASLEAGIKYLVQSAAGSVLVLIGIGLVLMETGSLEPGRDTQLCTTIAAAPGSRRAFHHRLRGQGSPGPHAHLASGRTLSGAQWDQRHAFRGGHRSRVGCHAARADFHQRHHRHLGTAVDGLWCGQYVGRESACPATEAGQAAAGVLQPCPHWLHVGRHWHCHLRAADSTARKAVCSIC